MPVKMVDKAVIRITSIICIKQNFVPANEQAGNSIKYRV